MKPIIEEEIIKIICKFDKNKSAGHDGIGNLIVKRVANEIARPLSAIFNLSLTTGIFTDQLFTDQYVSYNCNKSELKNILCGVPQGSILGPLHFLFCTSMI